MYASMCVNMLGDDLVTPEEKFMLANYVRSHKISVEAQDQALAKAGWTREEFEAGERAPREEPAEAPSEVPAEVPSEAPAAAPSEAPAAAPGEAPAAAPSEAPAAAPSEAPAVEDAPANPSGVLGGDTSSDSESTPPGS